MELSKKQDFSFDIATLTDYTNENTGLMARAVYGAKTISSGIEVLPGQKGNVSLNVNINDIYLQAAACGWTTSGHTWLKQMDVAVCRCDYMEALCPKDLEVKWYGQLMAKGSMPETYPFAEYVLDNKIAELSTQIEYMFWQADTKHGSGNLALCAGMADFLSGCTGLDFCPQGTGYTAADIIASVNYMVADLDERVAMRDDLVLFMPIADYRTWIQQLVNANMYHYDPGNSNEFEYKIPGTNITAMGVPGLRGTHYWYLTPKSNIVFVTDLLDETEDLDMWYSRDNREIRINGSFKFGVGVYFCEFVVTNNALLV